MRAFSTLLLLAAPFLTHGLFVRNGECSQILDKQASWLSGAQYRTSFNPMSNPDWKLTLSFDRPLAAFEAADGIIITNDLQNIEIRPKNYLKSAPYGSGLDMLVKFRSGHEAKLNAVSLNGYMYSCDTKDEGQGLNSVAKFVPEGIEVKFPIVDNNKEKGYVFDRKNEVMHDVKCDVNDKNWGCSDKKKGFESKIYCKEEEVSGEKEKKMKCSWVKVTKETHESNCYPDQLDRKSCDILVKEDACKSDKNVAKDCFTSCFCK